MTKEFVIIKIGVEEGVDLGSRIKDCLLSQCGVIRGILLSFDVV